MFFHGKSSDFMFHVPASPLFLYTSSIPYRMAVCKGIGVYSCQKALSAGACSRKPAVHALLPRKPAPGQRIPGAFDDFRQAF